MNSLTRLIPANDWPKHHAWPPIGGLRHLIFHAKDNGFDTVIRRVGRRVLVDEQAFFFWVDDQSSCGAQPQPSTSGIASPASATKRRSHPHPETASALPASSATAGRRPPYAGQSVLPSVAANRSRTGATIESMMVARGEAV